jgi:hypothetical protein
MRPPRMQELNRRAPARDDLTETIVIPAPGAMTETVVIPTPLHMTESSVDPALPVPTAATDSDSTVTPAIPVHPAGRGQTVPLVLAASAGAMVAISLGVYAGVHQPTHGAITTFGFSGVTTMKVWLATAAFVLAGWQLVSALWLYGRLPIGRPPRWLGFTHRWSGTTAFVVSLPVAFHCLWSIGALDLGPRQLVHAIFGCAFYGAMATKLLALHSDRLPRWCLPVAGSLLVTCLTVVWLTSSLWFFTTVGVSA